MAAPLGSWCIYCRQNVTVRFASHEWQCYNASRENHLLVDEAMQREVRLANVDLQPDAFPDNNSDMFGVGFGDSFDEEEQEGDEDMYPLSRNLGEHNFATHFNFADHIDPDKLAPGNSSNSPAECGRITHL
jgi:hypothetical protein